MKLNPNLKTFSLFLGPVLLGLPSGCLKPRVDPSSLNAASPSFDLALSPGEYALIPEENSRIFAKCAESLGALPDFTCVDGDLDGSSVELPALIDKPISRAVQVFVGHVGESPENNYKALRKSSSNCENPQQLAGSDGMCYTGSRVGQLPSFDRKGKLMPHVKTGFICRRYQNAPKKPAVGYSDVAIIQANTKTGETCFYQFLEETDSETIPSPFKWSSLEKLKSTKAQKVSEGKKELLAGRDFFTPEGSNCVKCHDSDPFIHTRHVDSIIRSGKEIGRPIIPKHFWGLKSDYKVLSAEARSSHVFVNPDPIGDGRETCTSCHKIGVRNTCKELENNQWFGDFLTDHQKIAPDKIASGMDAILACCNAARSRSDESSFTATSRLGKTIQCGRGNLPKAL